MRPPGKKIVKKVSCSIKSSIDGGRRSSSLGWLQMKKDEWKIVG